MQNQTRIHALPLMLLKRQEINTENGFRKLNISEAFYFKIVKTCILFYDLPN